MKNEEAIKHLEEWKEVITSSHRKEVIDMAIEALRNEINCVKCVHYTERETDTGIKGVCKMDTVHREDLISRSRAIKDISYWATNIIDPKMLVKEDALYILESLPSADEQDDNRLYIRIYANDEPSRKAEKLYQICGETESQEVAQWLKEYFPSVDRSTEWIPFTKRPLTDEEKEEYPDWIYIFDCPLPDDGQEILLSNGKYVWTDTFFNDDGCYLDGGDDIDEGMAWMPLPKPYREDGEA